MSLIGQYALVLQSEPITTVQLTQMLNSLGYLVKLATSLKEGIALTDQFFFDIAIVDRKLNDGDGLEFLSTINREQLATKVICLSSMISPKERTRSFKLGVLDYLLKPINLEELKFKLASWKDYCKIDGDSYQVGKLTLRLNDGQLLLPERVVSLQPKELQILYLICSGKGRVVSKQRISQYLWPYYEHTPELETIDVYVRRIRQKLGSYKSCLKTKKGFGYYFVDDYNKAN